MNMGPRCGIVLDEGQNGYECGRLGTEECSDCGTELCDLHAEECDSCKEIFCGCCIFFHMREAHTKKPVANEEIPKRRTA